MKRHFAAIQHVMSSTDCHFVHLNLRYHDHRRKRWRNRREWARNFRILGVHSLTILERTRFGEIHWLHFDITGTEGVEWTEGIEAIEAIGHRGLCRRWKRCLSEWLLCEWSLVPFCKWLLSECFLCELRMVPFCKWFLWKRWCCKWSPSGRDQAIWN